MSRVVLLTSCWAPTTQARVVRVAESMAAAGRSVVVIAPASPGESGLSEAVEFIPARRRNDAEIALGHLRAGSEILVECADAPAACCARAWRDRCAPGTPVLLHADALVPGSDDHPGDAVLAPTRAHAERCVNAGFDPARVLIAPTPIAPLALFAPGSACVLCPTPIAPGRGLTELTDAWAASACGASGPWVLRFSGPIEDEDFARGLAARAVTCAGLTLTERTGCDEHHTAVAAVLIDPCGAACPSVLRAVARGRAVFAPEGSPTAEATGSDGTAFVFPPERGIRALIGVFDRLSSHHAPDLAEPGRLAREHLLRVHAPVVAAQARQSAYERALELGPAVPAPETPPRPWGVRDHGRQSMHNTARLRRAMLACHSEGLRRVALYGAGAFAKTCADALCEPPMEIIGFIDDDPARRTRRVWGFQVLCPDVALTADLDAVILTAPSCEEQIWQRTAWFRAAGIRVVPLVREHDELPAARAA